MAHQDRPHHQQIKVSGPNMPLLSASPAGLDTPKNFIFRGGGASTILPAGVQNESEAAIQIELTNRYSESLPAIKTAARRLQDAIFGDSPRVVDTNFGPLLSETTRPTMKREQPGPILPEPTPQMIWEREAAGRHESLRILLGDTAARESREHEHLRHQLPESSHQPSRRLGQSGGSMSQSTAHAMSKQKESQLPFIPQAASGGGKSRPFPHSFLLQQLKNRSAVPRSRQLSLRLTPETGEASDGSMSKKARREGRTSGRREGKGGKSNKKQPVKGQGLEEVV